MVLLVGRDEETRLEDLQAQSTTSGVSSRESKLGYFLFFRPAFNDTF